MTLSRTESERQQLLSTAHQDYEKGLNSYAFYKIKNHAIGEDLVQDTFLKTWKYLVKGGKVDVMKAFLYHVLNNLIVDQYRKRKNVSLDTLLEKGYEPGKDNSEQLVNTLDGKTALVLLQSLPEPYRRVLHLRYVQDLSLQEIALVMGTSKNTVTVQAHRGLGKLRVLYHHAKL